MQVARAVFCLGPGFPACNTLFWINNKRFFIGSITTFENVQINDSINYPFKGSGDDEHVFGGMMASFQQLGTAGEYKCNCYILVGIISC